MMKEVKNLIENQQQMGLLSDSQKLITKKFKVISPKSGAVKGGVPVIRRGEDYDGRYQFPFQRRLRKSSIESAISERARVTSPYTI